MASVQINEHKSLNPSLKFSPVASLKLDVARTKDRKTCFTDPGIVLATRRRFSVQVAESAPFANGKLVIGVPLNPTHDGDGGKRQLSLHHLIAMVAPGEANGQRHAFGARLTPSRVARIVRQTHRESAKGAFLPRSAPLQTANASAASTSLGKLNLDCRITRPLAEFMSQATWAGQVNLDDAGADDGEALLRAVLRAELDSLEFLEGESAATYGV